MNKYQVMPELSAEDYATLKADIAERGVQVPVEYDEDGNILDGHNRVQICEELGINEWPRVIRLGMSEEQKILHARKLNMARRHLTREQRQELIREQVKATPELSDRQIAQELKVDHKTVGSQRKELESTGEIPQLKTNVGADGKERPRQVDRKPVSVFAPTAKMAEKVHQIAQKAPEALSFVESEKISLDEAAKLARMPEERREKVIEKIESGETKRVVEAQRQVISKEVAEVEAIKGKYRIIYADPPWQYGNTMPDTFTEQRDHYPTMPLKDICDMPIREIVADNAVLFLWVTSPILEESFDVVRAWGFKYKSSFIWDKQRPVMGHYNGVQHEILLICTRGSCQPDVRQQINSIVSIPRTQHSEKPEYFREIIDTIYPYGKRIELFARKQIEGWDSYGNQLG